MISDSPIGGNRHLEALSVRFPSPIPSQAEVVVVRKRNKLRRASKVAPDERAWRTSRHISSANLPWKDNAFLVAAPRSLPRR